MDDFAFRFAFLLDGTACRAMNYLKLNPSQEYHKQEYHK